MFHQCAESSATDTYKNMITSTAGASLFLRANFYCLFGLTPARAGLGIGKRLLAALEQLARGRGIARLHLSASLNAVPFYRAAGFVALREEAYAHPSGISLASVAMEKQLVVA